MGRINRANLKKTIYYMKRNGIRRTWYAVLERLEERKMPPYVWTPTAEAVLENQREGWQKEGLSTMFSVIVPAYRTKPEYLKELAESLHCQTYPRWELIVADATEDDAVERALGDSLGPEVADPRIRYVRLPRNAGIAENTNQALPYATGDYIGLLDHDDVLTPDALYEMAAAVGQAKGKGTEPAFLYSDEDKCNGDGTEYFEPHWKEDFNFDLLLSNNYICHFLVMKRELMQRLRFRPEYEGAQDFDLVLRAVASLGNREQAILHIPKVLYHWRCHPGSTAQNPESKRHAYEAGRRAVQDFADRQGWAAQVMDTPHVGFYALRYEGNLFSKANLFTKGSLYASRSLFDSRPDVGAVAGRIIRGGRVAGGRLVAEGEQVRLPLPGAGGNGAGLVEAGEALYRDLPIHYSGYMHRAALSQDARAADIRNIRVRPECRKLFERVTGAPYRTAPGTDRFDASLLPEGCDIRGISLEFGRALREAGYRILYMPEKDCDKKI